MIGLLPAAFSMIAEMGNAVVAALLVIAMASSPPPACLPMAAGRANICIPLPEAAE